MWKPLWNWIRVEAGRLLRCVLEKVNIAMKGFLKMILMRTQKEKNLERKARESQRPVIDAWLPFSTNRRNFPCSFL